MADWIARLKVHPDFRVGLPRRIGDQHHSVTWVYGREVTVPAGKHCPMNRGSEPPWATFGQQWIPRGHWDSRKGQVQESSVNE